jgi:diguanylate cyclase (GGDEF)-like protein/PAS domain S-box-containing protein
MHAGSTDKLPGIDEATLLRHLLTNVTDMIWATDLSFRLIYVSPSVERLFGETAENYLKRSVEQRFPPESRNKIITVLQEELAKEGDPAYPKDRTRLLEVEHFRADGTRIWVSMHVSFLRDENGDVMGLHGVTRDISYIVRVQQELLLEKERLQATLLSIGDGVISTDNQGRVRLLNRVATELTGWSQDEALGRPLDDVFHIIDEFSRERCVNLVDQILVAGEPMELVNDGVLVSRDGNERPVEENAAPIRDDKGNITGAVLAFRDVTEKRERQAEVEYLSFYDVLTGLYNRRFLEEELRRLDTERNYPLTVAVVDINGLKLLNDAFGHGAGDEVLQRVAAVMKREVRADDIIARIGGDEFVVLLPKTSSAHARQIAQRITEAVANEEVESIPLSASCGLEAKTERGQEMSTIFKAAEDDLYRRKLLDSSHMRRSAVQAIIQTLHGRNQRERRHAHRVSQLCAAIGSALGLSQSEISELRTAGLLHDIGKVALEEEMLSKAEPLSDKEWLIMKRHPEIGYRILSSVTSYAQIAEYVLAHQERWDGQGYPKGLSGEEIPFQARIIAVADSYDSMTEERAYGKLMSSSAALEEIRCNSGTQFDPRIAQVFLEEVIGSSLKR